MLTVLVGAALLLTAVLLAVMWWQQERIVFQPSRPPYPEGAPARRIDYTAEDGRGLFALLVGGPAGSPVRCVLAFHGNADLAAWEVPWAMRLAAETGALVVLPEYRGYAGLVGPPTVAGVRLDARAAYEAALRATGCAPDAVVLYGHSLGSAVAAELARDLAPSRLPRALLLESPLTSARDMARIFIGAPMSRAWSLVSRVHYDSEAIVRTLDVPVWVAHGDRDLIIPARMGRQVYAAARRKGELLLVAGAGHNDLAEAAAHRYWQWIARAVAAHPADREVGRD